VPTSRLARLGAICFRRRRRVLATWIAALAFTFVVLAPLAGEFRADFNTPGSDSEAADRVLQDRFPQRSSATIDVVWRAEDGVR
jgi:RND superfamily putative drug exporter